MRLTNVVLISSTLAEPINFSLKEEDLTSQFVVRQILGLDAEEIVAKFVGFSSHTNKRQFDFRPKSREIAMRVVINPNFELGEDYSDVRDDLYRTISATRTGLITLRFMAGATTVSQIVGRIAKFEVGYFNQLPEVQVTVECDDPMFRGVTPVNLNPDDINTTNPILLYDSLSTAPHGLTMQVIFTDDSDEFSIADAESDFEWRWRLVPPSGFSNGDVLYISSEFGARDVYVDPFGGGDRTRLADTMTPDSSWPILFPGETDFWIPQIDKITWQLLKYYPAYWGV